MEKTSKGTPKIGDRVGAFLSVVNGRGLFLGYGTYVGDEVPPNEGHGSWTAFLAGVRRANPKLVLDSGEVVWGCECWWGPENEIKEERARLSEVFDITMKDARAGKIPAGFEDHRGEGTTAPPMGDFFGSSGGGGKDFWS